MQMAVSQEHVRQAWDASGTSFSHRLRVPFLYLLVDG